jgi:nucleotide-binding universal stress UspA family protein
MKLTTILVPLDGSTLAEMALPKATELAQASGATILLVRAAEARSLPGLDPTEGQVRVVDEAERYLAGVAERLAAEGTRNVATAVWYGPPSAAIIDAARLREIDLIVMTTHGRTGIPRLLFGSVAESVLRGTHVPILLIRPAEAAVEPPAGSAEARPWRGSGVTLLAAP